MKAPSLLRLWVVVSTLMLAASPSAAASPAPAEVVINATSLEPHVLHTVLGQRVDFVKRVAVRATGSMSVAMFILGLVSSVLASWLGAYATGELYRRWTVAPAR